MKKVETSCSDLPYDCWCNVISFLKDRHDFLNLILVVKGLSEYISKISPGCTDNIVAELSAFPSIPSRLISCLRIGGETGIRENSSVFLQKWGSSSVNDLFDRIPFFFPNVLKLEVFLKKDIRYNRYASMFNPSLPPPTEPKFSWDLSNVNITGTKQFFLKYMILRLSLCNLTINQHFPKLEYLEVVHFGNITNIFSFSPEEINTTSSSERKSLHIEWTKLPRLSTFRVHGFSMTTSLPNHLHLKELIVSDSKGVDVVIEKLETLQTLLVLNSCLRFLSVGFLSNLKFLAISSQNILHLLDDHEISKIYVNRVFSRNNEYLTSDSADFNMGDEFTLRVKVIDSSDFPVLETFLLQHHHYCNMMKMSELPLQNKENRTPPFVLRNLSKLKNLHLHNLRFPVQVTGCKNIEHLDFCGCRKGVFGLSAGENGLGNLKKVKFSMAKSVSNIRTILEPLIVDCKSVEYISIRMNRNHFEEEEEEDQDSEEIVHLQKSNFESYTELFENSNTTLDLSDLANLRQLDFKIDLNIDLSSNVLIGNLQNCVNLEEMDEIIPTRNCCFESIPQMLKKVNLRIYHPDCLTNFLHHMKGKNLKELQISFRLLETKEMIKVDIPYVQSCYIDKCSFERSSFFQKKANHFIHLNHPDEISSSFKIRSLDCHCHHFVARGANVENLSILPEDQQIEKIEVTNSPFIEKISIHLSLKSVQKNRWRKNILKKDIIMKNLPSCEKITLTGPCFFNNIRIQADETYFPLKVLSLRLSDLYQKQSFDISKRVKKKKLIGGYESSIIITERNFKTVETLEIFSKGYECETIKKISNLKRLKRIRLRKKFFRGFKDMDRENNRRKRTLKRIGCCYTFFSSFVDEVEGVDLNQVKIEKKMVDITESYHDFGCSFKYENERFVEVCTLGDYIRNAVPDKKSVFEFERVLVL